MFRPFLVHTSITSRLITFVNRTAAWSTEEARPDTLADVWARTYNMIPGTWYLGQEGVLILAVCISRYMCHVVEVVLLQNKYCCC